MTMKTFTLAAAAALLAAIASAQAAEITFYDEPAFGGRDLVVRGTTPDFRRMGYNDRASSAYVRSGVWEVCTDTEFRGFCASLSPGEYRELDPRLSNRISSVREVAPVAAVEVRPRRELRGAIQLFGQPGFRGRALQLDRDTADLGAAGFDNRASSAVITDGTWELCTDAGFDGACRIYVPGRYPDLGAAMSKQITSARLVRMRPEAPLVQREIAPEPPVAQRENRRGPDVELFEDMNFGGSRFATERDVPDLDTRGFNDKARSMIISEGRWEVCVDGGFNGRCVVYGPGRYADLRGLNNEISSLRRVN